MKNQIEFDPNNFTLIYLLILGLASASVGFLMDIIIDQLQRGITFLFLSFAFLISFSRTSFITPCLI